MKAFNILWDVDEKEDLAYLPKEMDIPEWLSENEEISDWLSDKTQFCHGGFDLEEDPDVYVPKNKRKAFRRDVRNRKIAHRKMICRNRLGFDWYKHDGQYSKGKIFRAGAGHPKKKIYPSSTTEKMANVATMKINEYFAECETM